MENMNCRNEKNALFVAILPLANPEPLLSCSALAIFSFEGLRLARARFATAT